MKSTQNQYVKRRHKFFFWVLRPVAHMIAWKYRFRAKKLKIKKGENYLILSNHQGTLDPILVALSYKMPVYFVATDTFFSSKWYSRLLCYALAPIKKRKGEIDVGCIRTMKQISASGGSICMFPEANRSWCDFQFHIDKSICKLVRMLKMPLVLHNLHGLYGANPRWSSAVRHGKTYGEPQKVISWKEICAMSDDELHREIVSTLKVIDADAKQTFKSKHRAEDLERLLFVCPKCGSFSTLHSKGSTVGCSHCGFSAEYGEDLRLHCDDSDVKLDKLVDWYKLQLERVKNHEVVPNETIFEDDNVELHDQNLAEHPLLHKGTMLLNDKTLQFGEFSIPLNSITSATCIGGKKLAINVGRQSYLVVGNNKFNPIKYVLFFNVLCKEIIAKGGDVYYALSIDDAHC